MILVCISGIFLFWFLFLNVKGDNKKYFVVSASIILFLYAALRAHNLQIDIPRYVDYYEEYAKLSFDEIMELFDSEQKDPFYYVFSWLFSRIFKNVQWWLAFVALAYIFAVGLIIYKESESPVLSFLAFLSLAYFEFSLSGLRQTLALSLTLLSYFGIKNRKWKQFLILVLLASLFHRSALIFLIVYPIANTKVGKIHWMLALIVGVIFLVGESSVRSFMEKYLVDTQYEGYIERTVGLSMAGFIIQLVIFVFCYVYYPVVSKKYEHANILYNLAFIGLLFQLFSSMIAEVFRISMYFSFFNAILIPMVITAEKDRKIQLMETLGIGLIFIAYMFMTGIPDYAFFWN